MDIALMLKPASSGCNMRCSYCFYRSLSEERETPFFGFMTENTANATIDGAFDFARGGKVRFVFQGGEPTLVGLHFYEKFIERVKIHDERLTRTSFALQTNGLLLDDKWAMFLAKYNFLVGISLDGDSRANRCRVDGDGAYVTERILTATRTLKEHSVDFNILCVVTKMNADAGRLFDFFERKGFHYIQLIRCLKPLNRESKATDEDIYLSDEEYADFLCDAYKEYRNRSLRKAISVRNFDGLMFALRGVQTDDCDMQGHCSIQFIIEGNGNVYPCDFYCLDEYLMGNVNDNSLLKMASSRAAVNFVKSSLCVREECKLCDVYKLCKGGCRRYRECYDVCLVNKKLLHYILRFNMVSRPPAPNCI